MRARTDVVLFAGHDPVEDAPSFWNVGKGRAIIHLDSYPCDVDNRYQPKLELRGGVAETLFYAHVEAGGAFRSPHSPTCRASSRMDRIANPPARKSSGSDHPLSIVL